MIKTKRIYELASGEDGVRVLVDRVWPRGVKRSETSLDAWAKELAPSSELRKWFGHDPARWDEFRRRYAEELEGRSSELRALKAKAGDGTLTLLYGARDKAHNNAAALKEYLERL